LSALVCAVVFNSRQEQPITSPTAIEGGSAEAGPAAELGPAEGDAAVEPSGPIVEPQTVAPDTEQGLLDLARMHKERKEYDKARRALEDLLELNPTNLEGHYLLAWVCAESGDEDRARMEFTAVTNLAEPGTERYRQAVAALERLSQ